MLETTLTFNPTHFEVATGDVRLWGSIVDIDPTTGRATAIERLVLRASEVAPPFNPEPTATVLYRGGPSPLAPG